MNGLLELFQDGKSRPALYYAGIIAETPKFLNEYRYLIFFDDGYAQYCTHDQVSVADIVSWPRFFSFLGPDHLPSFGRTFFFSEFSEPDLLASLVDFTRLFRARTGVRRVPPVQGGVAGHPHEHTIVHLQLPAAVPRARHGKKKPFDYPGKRVLGQFL